MRDRSIHAFCGSFPIANIAIDNDQIRFGGQRPAGVKRRRDDVVAALQKTLDEPCSDSVLRPGDDCRLLREHLPSSGELNPGLRLGQAPSRKTIGPRYRRCPPMQFRLLLFWPAVLNGTNPRPIPKYFQYFRLIVSA